MNKPFTMASMCVLFFNMLFSSLMSPADAEEYIAGLILLGAAPCTAMVLVWSQLTQGDATYTLVQVSVNDIIMIFAFAPIVALLLGVTSIVVPWETLFLSVALYVVIPLAAGAATRNWLIGHARRGESAEAAVARFRPDQAGLRGRPAGDRGAAVRLPGTGDPRPLLIALIAAPLLVQSYGIFAIAYAMAWAWRIRSTLRRRR
jgi:ACR3 family arsenite transporter